MDIVKIPNDVLTTPSKNIESIDKKTLDFIEEMKRALLGTKKPKGVGLAAPQVGKGVKIFITKPWPESKIEVFINPEIIEVSKETTKGVPERKNEFEGCLSISNIWGVVFRHLWVKLSYQTIDGKHHTKKFNDFMATIIQHEVDHLNGILFTQRALEQKNKLYRVTGVDKEGNDVFEEIKVK